MAIKSFDELISKVKSGRKSTVALVCANDEHALEAVIHASDIVNAILVVEKDKVEDLNSILASLDKDCLLYTSPSPRDFASSRMPSSA